MSGKSQVSLVSCQQISKSFEEKPLFEEFSFGVYSGDRLGIIGPNGSGKTTLLNILAQREVVDKGEVTVSRGLCQAYLAQQDQFEPSMTIELLLESTLADQRLELPQLQKRIAKVRGIFKLPQLLVITNRLLNCYFHYCLTNPIMIKFESRQKYYVLLLFLGTNVNGTKRQTDTHLLL